MELFWGACYSCLQLVPGKSVTVGYQHVSTPPWDGWQGSRSRDSWLARWSRGNDGIDLHGVLPWFQQGLCCLLVCVYSFAYTYLHYVHAYTHVYVYVDKICRARCFKCVGFMIFVWQCKHTRQRSTIVRSKVQYLWNILRIVWNIQRSWLPQRQMQLGLSLARSLSCWFHVQLKCHNDFIMHYPSLS